ncbi:MAG: type II toxin-antitoxin system VapC family toxin [Pleurocapsa sp.]
MYLLDTNICIALIKANPTVMAVFLAKAVQCYIPTLVLGELYKGVYCSQKVEKNLADLNQFLTLIAIVEFDRAAALEFGLIQGELKRKGKPTGETDALIAAVARSRNDTLVTDNIRHFKNIEGLKLENWLDR